MIEPCCEDEVAQAVEYCLDTDRGELLSASGLRPVAVPFDAAADYRLERGAASR